ncbi:MAG: hypothetical protein RL026_2619 [Pseudomonadota bacterium]|jgi:hypothetical protein
MTASLASTLRAPWVVALAVGLLAGMLWRLPLAWVSPWLSADTLRCVDPAGSLWRGACQDLQVGAPQAPLKLGQVHWDWHLRGLLRGAIIADVRLQQPAADLTGRLTVQTSGRVRLDDTRARLDLGQPGLPAALLAWSGRVSTPGLSVSWQEGALTSLQGRVEVAGLARASGAETPWGDLSVVFAPPAGGPSAPVAVATVSSAPGNPVAVRGQLRLLPGGEWIFDGGVAGGATLPQALQRQMLLLGSPDADGYRPLSLSGRY